MLLKLVFLLLINPPGQDGETSSIAGHRTTSCYTVSSAYWNEQQVTVANTSYGSADVEQQLMESCQRNQGCVYQKQKQKK